MADKILTPDEKKANAQKGDMKVSPPETEQPEPKTAPEPMSSQPTIDPILVRQQQLQQLYQQINGRIMELRQQRQLIDDMIMDTTSQADRIVGAMNEIAYQQEQMKKK